MRKRTPEELAKFFEGFEESLMPKPKPKPVSAAEHNRRVRQMLAQERWEQRRRELPRELLQRMIDQSVELNKEAQRELEEEARRTCHRGPGDPDYHR
jgi:hypothetical protein